MTVRQVKNPAVMPQILTSMGCRLPESLWKALGCLCSLWGAAAWAPMAWLVFPDVIMHRPAASLRFMANSNPRTLCWCSKRFNRLPCKQLLTVVQATHIGSRGHGAECGLGLLFVWICSLFSKQLGVSACMSCLLGWRGWIERGILPSCSVLYDSGIAAIFWNPFWAHSSLWP